MGDALSVPFIVSWSVTNKTNYNKNEKYWGKKKTCQLPHIFNIVCHNFQCDIAKSENGLAGRLPPSQLILIKKKIQACQARPGSGEGF